MVKPPNLAAEEIEQPQHRFFYLGRDQFVHRALIIRSVLRLYVEEFGDQELRMYVKREIEPRIVWFFSWKPLIVFTLWSGLAYFLYSVLGVKGIAIPFLPVATIGTAVAFYVGFKNNASYERLWEARKIWAEIEHLSRFTTMLVLKDTLEGQSVPDLAKRFIYTQLAWINCLRLQLRYQSTFHDEDATIMKQAQQVVGDATAMKSLKTELVDQLTKYGFDFEDVSRRNPRNIASGLLFLQVATIDALRKQGMNDEDYGKILESVSSCSQQQLACERINSFPFPRQYGYFSDLYIKIFIALLPFSLLGEVKVDATLTVLIVPFTVLISWVFYTMEQVAVTSENPFENALNDVPLTTICREIEIDLKGMLGEKDLPPVLEHKDFILL